MDLAVSFQEAVGDFVRRFRVEHDLTLDQIAHTSRRYGSNWGPNSVRNIENGQSALTIKNLILLGLSLNTAAGTELTLNDLFGDAEEFSSVATLPANTPLSRAALTRALSGEPLTFTASDMHPGGASGHYQDVLRMITRMQAGLTPVEGEMDLEELDAFSESGREPTLAETRLGKKLGVSPLFLAVTAYTLWGHSLDEESALRAGNAASPQARGRITRLLREEIINELKPEISNG